MLNVGFVVNSLDVGGLEKMVVSLVNNLDRARFTPYLICLSHAGKLAGDIDVPDERRLVLNKGSGWRLPVVGVSVDVPLFQRLRRFVRDNRIDILHAHNLAPFVYAAVATRLVPLRRRPRIVYSDHNQLFSMNVARSSRVRWYLKLADQVIAVSEEVKRLLVEELKAPAGKVRVLYNGIDGRTYSRRDRGRLRRELSIPDGAFVVGTAATLSVHKGIDYLLEAARQVLARAPDTWFVIAGDGPERAKLEAAARALGLGDRLTFLGYRSDVADVVSALDLYVLPSLTEGLSLSLLEALAIGVPILCTRVGGNPEIVEDGVNGYLVPARDSAALADGIERMRADPAFRDAARARNVKKFTDRFTLEAMVAEHARLFTALAG